MKAWIISAVIIVVVGLAAERIVIRHYLLPANASILTASSASSPASVTPASNESQPDKVQRLTPPSMSPRSASDVAGENH
jgi:hypothetical protein